MLNDDRKNRQFVFVDKLPKDLILYCIVANDIFSVNLQSIVSKAVTDNEKNGEKNENSETVKWSPKFTIIAIVSRRRKQR